MIMNLQNKKLLTDTFAFLEAIHQTGSYTKASTIFHKKQSNLSKEIRKAELALDTKLVDGKSRGAHLTADGIKLLEFAKQQEELLYNAANFSLACHNISGDVSIAITDGIGIYLIPHLVKFQNLYPNVKITIFPCTNNDTFANEKIDIAITYKYPSISKGLIITEHSRNFGLFASVDFIKENKMPKDLDDLTENYRICNHIEYCDNWKEWRKIISKAKNVSTTIYSSNLLIQATEHGMGIALQPINYGNARKDWLPIDLGVKLKYPCYVLSRHSAQKTEKIRVLLEYINNIMKDI